MERPSHRRGAADSATAHSSFPRASEYSADWLIATEMGLPVLWLTEWLAESMPLERDSRVLDLGCGLAASSIFLAEQYGLRVTAADVWASPTDN